VVRTLEGAFDVIVDLWCTLTQVCPGGRVLEKAILVCTLGSPDDASTGSRRIQSSMWLVTIVSTTELAVDGRFDLYS